MFFYDILHSRDFNFAINKSRNQSHAKLSTYHISFLVCLQLGRREVML